MKKRLLTVLLAVCLVIALGTVTAWADDAVASVNGTEYSSLQDAIDAAEDLADEQAVVTINLLSSTIGGEVSFTAPGVYVLNLNGHTYTSTDDDVIRVMSASVDLTIENGKLYSTNPNAYGIYVYALDTNEDNKVDVTCDDVTVTLDGVELDVADQGLGVQGLNTNNNLIVKNSTVKAGTAIYFPPISGSLVIENSNIIGTNNGIFVKGGDVTISGNSTVSASAEGNIPQYPYPGSGTLETTGMAIYVEGGYVAEGGTPRPMSVTIYDGTIKSKNSYSVYDNNIVDSTVQKIQVLGGHFEDGDEVTESVVQNYIPEGAALNWNSATGEVVADEAAIEAAAARVGSVYYDTLSNAIAAADDGDTVEMLADETGPTDRNLWIPNGVTLDLGGNTLTAGYQIAIGYQGNTTATVKNGTLIGSSVAAGAAYNAGGSLTLDQVTVISRNDYCAVQNNSGNITLIDCMVYGYNGGGIYDFGTKSSVTLKNSDVTGSNFAVYHNGLTAGFTLNAENCTIIGDSEVACAIYVSGSATNTAESADGMNNINLTNCTVTGPTGIEGKYTNMVLTNCDITATAEPDFEQYNNGSTALGFSVVSTDNSMKPNDPAPEAKISIEGGTYVGLLGLTQYEGIDEYENFKEASYTVSDGNFSSSLPKEYLAPTLTAELYSRSNPDAPYSYYPSVAAAQAAAQPGDVITDLTDIAADAEDAIVIINYGNGDVQTINSKVGATITLTAPTRNGYTFGGWRYGNTVYKAGETVKVTSDMTFTAIWNAINIPDTYDIDLIVGEGGEAKTNFSNASAGTTITVTVTPDEGYELDYITVDGERISGTTFKMPDHDVTVRVTFSDSDALPFTDVSAGQWFYDAISYVYTNGMMEGDSATTFNPDGQMTRAMFWAVLGRIDGATITGANWVETARSWAMAEGVSDGTNPNDYVTREMMVTMLWRYAGEPASEESLSGYSDAANVSDWAAEAMSWALETGVIEGVTATTLQPQGTATRAQCATIFMRYDMI